MKKLLFILLSLLVITSCSKQGIINEPNNTKKEKINITTSIIPLASISNYIGWEYVNAKSLVPVWVSAHGYDLKASQMVNIEESDLVVYLWLEHIDWFLDKALSQNNNYIKVAKDIKLIEWKEHEHEHEHEHENEEEEHENEHNHEDENNNEEEHEEETHTIDPHVWTSWGNAIIIARYIKNKLIEIDNKNSDYYTNNFELFSSELNQIKNEYLEKHNWLNQKEFLIFHDAYNYLFEELDINQDKKLIFQKNVLSNPNSKEMKELIDEIRVHWINIAYKEPQLDDNNLQKISDEYNIEIKILNPLGSDYSKEWYIKNYKNNIKNLEYIYE